MASRRYHPKMPCVCGKSCIPCIPDETKFEVPTCQLAEHDLDAYIRRVRRFALQNGRELQLEALDGAVIPAGQFLDELEAERQRRRDAETVNAEWRKQRVFTDAVSVLDAAEFD